MGLGADDRFSEDPETVTIPDWPSSKVDGAACKLLVKVNNDSRQPQMTNVKLETYSDDALMETFKMLNGQVLNSSSGGMETVSSRSWWPATLLADGTVEACHLTRDAVTSVSVLLVLLVALTLCTANVFCTYLLFQVLFRSSPRSVLVL